jgi:hypothetical protein
MELKDLLSDSGKSIAVTDYRYLPKNQISADGDTLKNQISADGDTLRIPPKRTNCYIIPISRNITTFLRP